MKPEGDPARRTWSAIVGGSALVIRVPFMFDPRPVIQPDTVGYMSIADQIPHGHFGPEAAERPPGYPLFIALVRLLPGRGVDNVIVAQHILGVALAVGILLVTWRLFGKPAGVVAGLLAAISPQLVAVEHYLLSDYLFLLLVFAGTAALAFVALSPSKRLLVIPGVLFGMATLTKPLGQVLIVLAPVVLTVLVRRWRTVARGSLVVTLGMGLLVFPWVARNETRTGHPVVSTIGDEVLFWRAFDGDRPLPFVGNDAVTNMVRRLYAKSRAARDPTAKVWSIMRLLHSQGYTQYAAGVQERRMALRAIGAHPFAFAKDSINHFGDYATTAAGGMTDTSVGLIRPAYTHVIASAPSIVRRSLGRVSWRALRSASIVSTLWWLLSGFALTGVLLVRSGDPAKRVAVVTFASAWVVMGLALALTGLPELRYNAVGVPLVWVVGSAGLVFVATALWERVRERRRRVSAVA